MRGACHVVVHANCARCIADTAHHDATRDCVPLATRFGSRRPHTPCFVNAPQAHYRQCRTRQPMLDDIRKDVSTSANDLIEDLEDDVLRSRL